ncbi:MAG: MCE family protein [Rhodococcus sp. (in: high G+C Gram-positive bacteria)]|nr:MCE family protein [Rhodococcus sp. (in: high G+C Gram-positive bacteria)]
MIVTGTSRIALSLRGLLAVAALIVAYVFLFSRGTDTFSSAPQVSAVVPASAGALRVGSSVQYRGVVVGSVADIEPGTTASTVSLAIDEGAFEDIPSTSQVRLMPRNIFGDFFVDLIQPDGLSRGPALAPGTELVSDQSEVAVQLYQSISRIYSLVSSLDPADINVALTAVSDAMSGKGNQIGESLDSVHHALVGAQPVIDGLGDDLDDIATLADSLSSSAPDILAAFENSITTSKTVVEKSDGLASLLRAGTSTGSTAATVIGDNRDRMITVIDDADSLTGAITSRPDHITTFYTGLRNLTIKLPPALAQGPWLSTDLRLSVTDLYPYGKTDCPQYDAARGPNCPAAAAAFGGTVGPVGSPVEQSLIAALTQGGTALDTLVAGPVLRGTTVVGE